MDPSPQLSDSDRLLARLALHYKLVSNDQLAAAARRLGTVPLRSLGEELIDLGAIDRAALGRLEQVAAQMRSKSAVSSVAVAPAPASPAASPSRAPVAAPAVAPFASPAPGQTARADDRSFAGFVTAAAAAGASDLHLATGQPPWWRLAGRLQPVEGAAPVGASEVRAILEQILSDRSQAEIAENGQTDFALTLPAVARLRGNAYRQQTGADIVMRIVPTSPPTLAELALPETLSRFVEFSQGLVLLTGPAGCGKSSTLAALVAVLNERRADHILTLEDPVEILHTGRRASINQRQVGRDTVDFARGLRAALREDPDVIVLGELRDTASISLALTAAETGHLVLGTLHTGNAVRTIDRLIGAFPPDQQGQVRTQLGESLRAVISQRLLARADGAGRVPAIEVLVGTRAVGNLIRESKTFQIRSAMQTGAAQGQVLLEASIAKLVKDGVVTAEEAARHGDEAVAARQGSP